MTNATDGRRTQEVAQLLGIPPSTLYSFMRRFPQRLAVRKDDRGNLSWTEEDVASLRRLVTEARRPRPRLSTKQAATLAGVSYRRLLSLIRRRRHELPVVKQTGFLDWTPGAVAVLRALVARWRAKGIDDRPLPEPVSIRNLAGRDLVLVAPVQVFLSVSRKLGITARLAGLNVQAQGSHPRAAVALLRRHLELRYLELQADPQQAPELWAGLQKLIVPRPLRRKPRGPGRRTGLGSRSSKEG